MKPRPVRVSASEPGAFRDAIQTAPLVGLFVAGYVKASPVLEWVPADLTLLMYGALVLVTAYEAGRVLALPRGLAPFLVMVAAFTVGAFEVVGTAYAERKLLLLFGLTLPAAFAAAMVVSSPARAWWLCRWTLVAGLGVGVLLRVAPSTAETYGVLAAEGSDTISIGRACGAALVAAVALAVGKQLRWSWALAAVGVLTMIVLGAGQRGPLVGVAFGVAVLLLARPGVKRLGMLAAGAAAVVLLGPWLLARTNSTASERIMLLFADDKGVSIDVREVMYRLAAHVAWDHPGGVGWGGLENIIIGQEHPHNVALEVFAESGWVAGAAFAVVVVVAFVRLLRAARVPAVGAVLGLLVFWLSNAMFSGDVNDNRAAFALLAVALVVPGWRARSLRERADRDTVDADVQTRRGGPHVAVRR